MTQLAMNKAGVIGAGLMGSGIASHLTAAGVRVVMIDANPDQLELARNRINHEALTLSDKMSDLQDCDFVIEAVFEDLGIKQQVLADICDAVPATCIVASNTSSLLISDMASAVSHAERFVGVHYNNPADFNPIVEIIGTSDTDPELPQHIARWFNAHEKIAVICADTPCFILNRQSLPYLNEAARCAAIATPGEIDAIALDRLGVGLGPFAVMNLIGIPVVAAASRNLAVLGTGYQAAANLQSQSREWEIGTAPASLDALPKEMVSEVTQRLRGAMIYPGKDILDQSLCSADDLTKICKEALGYEKSSAEWLEIYKPAVTDQLIARYLSNQS